MNKQVMASDDETYGRIFLHMQAAAEGSSLGILFWMLVQVQNYLHISKIKPGSYPKSSNTAIIMHSRQSQDNPENWKNGYEVPFYFNLNELEDS